MQYTKEQYDESLHDMYKALTIKPHDAEDIAASRKTILVRSYPTKYRGELLITAAAGKSKDPSKNYGSSIAKVNLIDCKPVSSLTPEEWQKAIYKKDKEQTGYAWILDKPRRVIEFPVKGQSGLYTLIYTKDTIIDYPYLPIEDI